MLIPVEEARERILARFELLEAEEVPLREARGRVLAGDIVAGQDVPPFRNAAMDGYAIRAAETTGASHEAPVHLRVVGTVAAGMVAAHELRPGEAMRIMTGAPMPRGADAVVRFEETSEARAALKRADGYVAIGQEVMPGSHVRETGEDLRAGATVLEAGRRLGAAHLGVLASLGLPGVAVVRRPRVAILATGDELVPVGEPLAPGQIYNSNEHALAALVEDEGATPILLGIARDRLESLQEKLSAGAAAGADLFLTSAGVSVGDYDVVKDLLATRGDIHFWQVAIKPGKPLAFGTLRQEGREIPLLGLPGNPVAAMVAFHVFARPVLRRMVGRRPLVPPPVEARLLEPVQNSGRRHYMRARARRAPDGTLEVSTRGSGVRVQGSGILSSMLWANCFVVVPESCMELRAGSLVPVEFFDSCEEEI